MQLRGEFAWEQGKLPIQGEKPRSTLGAGAVGSLNGEGLSTLSLEVTRMRAVRAKGVVHMGHVGCCSRGAECQSAEGNASADQTEHSWTRDGIGSTETHSYSLDELTRVIEPSTL